MSEPIFTAVELAEIKAYREPLYWASVFRQTLILTWSLVSLRFIVAPLYRWSEKTTARFPQSKVMEKLWGKPNWPAALLFVIALVLLNSLITIPDSLYFGWYRERAFGMTSQSVWTFLGDGLKGIGLSLIPMAALAFGMLGLVRRLKHWWLLIGIVGAVALLFSAALDPYRDRLYYAQKPLPDGPLKQAIAAKMAEAKIEYRDVLVEETLSKTVRLQAYFAGKGPTRTIVVNDSLLKNLSDDEVLAAVAHEAGHANESQRLGHLASSLALILFLYGVERLFRRVAAKRWWGVEERADVRALPLVLFVFWLVTQFLNPISTWFSREKELAADRFGVALTKDPDAFIRMLAKAARVNKMDPTPPRWVVVRGWSHPPVQERIEAIERGAWKKADGG